MNADDAREQARALDARLARGEDIGPLAGIPLGVKDLEDAAGFVTTYGSALHVSDAPAEEDSVLVARLRAAGCVIIGKTNTPEFGFKGQTDNPSFGATANPWNEAFSAGGSSGGAGSALASGMVPLATGSDGGGSIRIPSAVCGLSGMKTSQGRVPNGGHAPPGSGLLTVKGPMAIRIRDVVTALDAVVGEHPTDIFSLPAPEQPWRPQLDDAPLPERVIWSPTLGFANMDREIAALCQTAVDRLEAAGTEVIRLDDIWSEDPVGSWFTLWAAYRGRAQGDVRGTADWERIDPALRFQIEFGLDRLTAVDFARAVDAAHGLNLALERAFERAPLIITPATSGHTPRLGHDGTVNGEETQAWVTFTYGLNLTRNPAGVISVDRTREGMPVSLQIVGRQRDDLRVLRALAATEDLFGTALAG